MTSDELRVTKIGKIPRAEQHRRGLSAPGQECDGWYWHPAREGVMAKIGHGTRATLRGPHLPHDVLEIKRVSYEWRKSWQNRSLNLNELAFLPEATKWQ